MRGGSSQSQCCISCALIKTGLGYTVLKVKCHVKQTAGGGCWEGVLCVGALRALGAGTRQVA